MWSTRLLYVAVEIQQLVNEMSSFPEVLYKRYDLKIFSKFTVTHKKQSSRGVLTKYVLENFTKFTDKHLCPSLFLNKAVGWKPETVRSSHWRYSVKKGALAFQNQCSIDHLQSKCSWIIHKIHCEKPVLESLFNKIAVLRTYNFTKEDSKTGAFLWSLQTF